MSSDAREKSWEDGAPVEYYDFVRGNTHVRYNTSDRDLVHNGETYASLRGLTRERIQQGMERNKLTLNVSMPRSVEIASWWHPFPSSSPIGLVIYGGHIGETDAKVRWIGRIIQPKFSATLLTLMAEPSATTSKKSGQVQSWQRGCMHVLYKQGDGLCNAKREDFAIPAVLSVVSGSVVVASAFSAYPDGRFAGGYIEYTTADGSIERRSINKHAGTSLTLFYGSADLAPGLAVVAYPGCAHNGDDCSGFFNNIVNYGGDLYAPEKSPYDGNPVF